MRRPFRVHLYNHVLRHWGNWRAARMWAREGRKGPCRRAAAITPEAWAWAHQVVVRSRGQAPSEPR
jgi:hypothetical protein